MEPIDAPEQPGESFSVGFYEQEFPRENDLVVVSACEARCKSKM